MEDIPTCGGQGLLSVELTSPKPLLFCIIINLISLISEPRDFERAEPDVPFLHLLRCPGDGHLLSAWSHIGP